MGWIMGGLLLTVLLRNRKSFEHAGFGADSAAPVVKKVMDAYFHFGEYAFAKDRSGAVLRKKGN